ncbi:MAG TPA: hypothetical protein VHT96_01715 [Clostridia bacterium]|nr:hypothetical protein [Clostridia bacterium]
MSLTVNLWSRKTGELKNFLESYYDKDMGVNDDQGEWACVYIKPLEAVDIISAVMDNSDRYQITILIQVDGGQLHHVTAENHNEIIKDIFLLFYNENVASYS